VKRRDFINKSLALTTSAGLVVLNKGCSDKNENIGEEKLRLDDPLLQKVTAAMLAMQRASWEQGVAAQALLEMGDMDRVVLMAKEAALRQAGDGRLADLASGDNVTDPGSNGEAVLRAAQATGDSRLQDAWQRMLDYFLHDAPRTADGTLHHIKSEPEVWVDSVYMAPPFIAVAGHPDEAIKQIEGFRRLLWNRENKLFSHIWDDGKKTFVRKAFWGVGNGWAAAGMTRVMAALPAAMAEQKKQLALYIQEVIDGCLAHQRGDGLFHDVVNDPSTFIETNLAQMLAYSIYRGVVGGWLESAYRPAADKMRQAARAKVDAYGLVQGVCGSPTFDHAGTATEGQAFFLLMETAARA
jgi:unsaturated rhamnogalacturonyl hydrolase